MPTTSLSGFPPFHASVASLRPANQRTQKSRAVPGFFVKRAVAPQGAQAGAAYLLARAKAFRPALSWRLWRAALFLWMSFLLTIESMTGVAALTLAEASSFLPALTAARAPLTAVRNLERVAMLLARRFTFCLARFSADLILATEYP